VLFRSQSTEQRFREYILELWMQTSAISTEVSKEMLGKKKGDNVDAENQNQFVANLMSLWKQLCPKIKGKVFKGDSNLEKEFNLFEKYRTDPQMLVRDTSDLSKSENIFKLEDVIRRALEQLKIT
jgi:hypothetical protein